MLRTVLTLGWFLGFAATVHAQMPAALPQSAEGEGHAPIVSSGDVIFDNITPNGGLNFDGAVQASQLDKNTPFDAGAADDFVLPDSPESDWSITGVQWSGRYWNPNGPGPITSFRIIFWPDAGGIPAGSQEAGLPPDYSQALAIFTIPGNANEVPNDGGFPYFFDYSVDLPEPFIADPNVTFWLEIQPTMNFSPQWGWQVTSGRQGFEPQRGFDFFDVAFWTPINDPGDLAFVLIGEPRSSADIDGNGEVNLDDYARFQECFTGPDGGPVEPGCEVADYDNDGDVDLTNWGAFQIAFTEAP